MLGEHVRSHEHDEYGEFDRRVRCDAADNGVIISGVINSGVINSGITRCGGQHPANRPTDSVDRAHLIGGTNSVIRICP